MRLNRQGNIENGAIANVAPGKFDAFRKILCNIYNNIRPSRIDVFDSQLQIPFNGRASFLLVDFTGLIGPGKTFGFTLDTGLQNKLKFFTGNEVVEIVESGGSISIANQRYWCEFSKGVMTHPAIPDLPEVSDDHKTGIVSELRRLRPKLRKHPVIKLQVIDDCLVKAFLPGGVELTFTEKGILNIEGAKSLLLPSKSFLVLDGYEAYINLIREGDTYWLITKTFMGVDMSATVYERFQKKA